MGWRGLHCSKGAQVSSCVYFLRRFVLTIKCVGCECIVIGKGLEVFENRSRNLDVQILYDTLVCLDRKIAREEPDTLSSYLALLEVRNVFEFWTSCYLASHINSLFHCCCCV
jgi:hypothetical protein